MQTNKLVAFISNVKKVYKYAKKHPRLSLIIGYVATTLSMIVLVLLIGLFNFLLYKTGIYNTQHLNVNSFKHVGIEVIDDYTFITEHEDGQLILTGAGYIQNLHIKLNFSQPPGEVIAFYVFDDSENFGAKEMLYGKLEDGTYSFRFPPFTKGIRFDCGVAASNTISIESLVVNRMQFFDLVPFAGNTLFLIFVLPLIVMPLFSFLAFIVKKYHTFFKFNK